MATQWGAEVPFLRPQELAEDEIGLVPVTQHAMREMDRLGHVADIVVSVQATSPFLEGKDIDRAIAKLEETDADSVWRNLRPETGAPRRLEWSRLLSRK